MRFLLRIDVRKSLGMSICFKGFSEAKDGIGGSQVELEH